MNPEKESQKDPSLEDQLVEELRQSSRGRIVELPRWY
jgi:hypothetical protein